jgi:hypothetical protein
MSQAFPVFRAERRDAPSVHKPLTVLFLLDRLLWIPDLPPARQSGMTKSTYAFLLPSPFSDRNRAAQFSLTTCRARPSASASAGTLPVMTEPEPT